MLAVSLSGRQATAFSLLCCLVYFTSYLTRINYGAAISEISDSLGVSNQLAGIALILSFVAYGVGQPFFGMLGDRLQPRSMIAAGLALVALSNIAVACLNNIYLIAAVWGFNGLFQAMLWPPLMRSMAGALSPVQFRRTSVGIVTAASAGTIGVYLLVPLCIHLSGWRLSFLLPAALALAVAAAWFARARDLPRRHSSSRAEVRDISNRGSAEIEDSLVKGRKTSSVAEENDPVSPAKTNPGSLLLASGLLPILLAIVLQGALRDGITTWMPTYIADTFHIGNAVSILNTAVLPLFAIASVAAASFFQRIVNNELKMAAYLWTAAFAAACLLLAVYKSNVVVAVAIISLLTGCIHGINLMLISLLPMHFAKFGRISTMSGILNAFTYVGSAGSIYGFAAFNEQFGWRHTIMIWSVMALAGAILCALCARRWGRFTASS
ncbi:MFS transporter [Paenibacillus sp. HB172176]|uniref:MFS transporter n=1 Tax=Paenibacillus sp. HB172176 TaxID=2493690 RepID=UPI00143A8FB9|nr:MFS transporter [Paenibacillus sp. HB172176]